MLMNSNVKELFLLKQKIVHFYQKQIYVKEVDIHFNYRYEKSNVKLKKNASAYKSRFVIRQIFKINNKNIYLL